MWTLTIFHSQNSVAFIFLFQYNSTNFTMKWFTGHNALLSKKKCFFPPPQKKFRYLHPHWSGISYCWTTFKENRPIKSRCYTIYALSAIFLNKWNTYLNNNKRDSSISKGIHFRKKNYIYIRRIANCRKCKFQGEKNFHVILQKKKFNYFGMGFLLQLFYGVSWSHVIFLFEEKNF